MQKDWKKFVEETEWHVFHTRRRSPFLQAILFGTGIQHPFVPFDHRVKYFSDFFDTIFISVSEKKKLEHRVRVYLKKDPEFLLRLMHQAFKQRAGYERTWKAVRGTNVKKLSNIQLATILQSYYDQLLHWGVFITLPLFVENYLEAYVTEELIKKFGETEGAQWVHVVLDPVKYGSVLEEEIALLRLATRRSVSTASLKKHAQQFSWMANVSYLETYYPVSYYAKRLAALKKGEPKKRLNELYTHRSVLQQKFARLVRLLKNDAYLQAMVRTTNEAVFFRSYRTEMYYSSARYFTLLWQEVARRFGIKKYTDLLWLYPKELILHIKTGTKPRKELIAERKKGFAFISGYNGHYWFWDGDEARTLHNRFVASQTVLVESGNQIKGSGAFSGIVRGRVVVVHSLQELGKVKKGAILVTHATNVNFVPALKKVAGIITEEGGILSHAAIISRELRIPCVIGTKIATKVFKDGDIVEVDATKGIIKKISKK